MSRLREAPEQRAIIHRVPVWDKDGTLTDVRWFRTKTEARKFAKEQAKALGHKGFLTESLNFRGVEHLLRKHVPAPEHYLPAPRSTT